MCIRDRYDSSGSATLSISTMKLICSFVRPRSRTIKFDILNVMPQPNAWDCGVFAIACATDIAHDRDPVLSQWDSTYMREHLESCFEQHYMSPFPTVKKRRVPFGRRVTKSIEETIHCTCRMPNDKQSAMIFAMVVTHGITAHVLALLLPSLQQSNGHVSNVSTS